jgi:hypothetical protein
VPAGAEGARLHRRRRHPGNVLHRLDERVRARTAAGGGVAARPRRLERDRHGRRFSSRALAGRACSRPPARTAKCEACERLGAERAINYREADFAAVVRDLTGGAASDVVLDMVGGEYFARNIDVLALEGRLVEIATLHGVKAELNIQTIMGRRLTITGPRCGRGRWRRRARLPARLRQHVWPLLESAALRPIVHATFPLRDAAEAHRVMEAGEHIGKLVLVV